jgi:Lrp/AsnC family transcriptional regulator, regulator for asnA, asnC and gidA
MPDELDRKIIRALNQNARKSFREVAKEVGSSVTSVINRVKKFEGKKAVRGYVPVVDPEYFVFKQSQNVPLSAKQKCPLLEWAGVVSR